MSAFERRRSHADLLGMALLAAAAVACGGAAGTTLDGGDAPAATMVAASNNEVLLELQAGLPAGNDAGWYARRLSVLDYEILELRQESDGVSVFRVGKSGRDYRVRVVMAKDGAVARSVEIAPAPALPDADIVDGPLVDRQQAAGLLTDTASRQPDDGGFGDRGDAYRSADTASQPEARPRQEPVGQAVPPQPPEPVAEPRSDVAPAPRDPVAAPPLPEPTMEPVASPPAPPRPEPRSYTVSVPAGTLMAARLESELSSADAQVGDGFAMHLTDAVWTDGVEILPAGATVRGYVVEVERAGRPNKGGRLVLATDSVHVGAESFALDALVSADSARLEGRDSAREDVKEVAIGAGLGGLVGGLLGGKKGVLVGVLAGGGGTFVATKGEEVNIARDAPLSLELRRDLNVTFVDGE